MNQTEISKRIESKFKNAVIVFKEDAASSFLVVKGGYLHDIIEFLKNDEELKFDYLRLLTGVDMKDRLTVVYHLYSYPKNHDFVLKVDLARENPIIDSISDIYGVANWYERETYDLMGINFKDHPDLRRIMLPDDWAGNPLRKDYVEPTEYRGISHKR